MCGIIASVELFLGIQNIMEEELVSSKEFCILYSDIFKTLSVEREYRLINDKIYLDNIHTKYCNLIEKNNLLKKTSLQNITNIVNNDFKSGTINIKPIEEQIEEQIEKQIEKQLEKQIEEQIEEPIENIKILIPEHIENNYVSFDGKNV